MSEYGYCPICSAAGVERERRPDGNDRCSNGHIYASKTAIASLKGTVEKCPECKTPLYHAVGIAKWCPNEDCPVDDCPDCWDGNGNYTPTPKIKIEFRDKKDDELDTLKRQRDMLLEALYKTRSALLNPIGNEQYRQIALEFADAAIAAVEQSKCD